MLDVFTLLLAFQAKHFLCDFPLQGEYMLGKFSKKFGVWFPALTAHCGVHFLGTLIICGWWGWDTVPVKVVFALACTDFVVHFCVDRAKVRLGQLHEWTHQTPQFWWALGADQAAHHVTHYAIIAALLGGVVL